MKISTIVSIIILTLCIGLLFAGNYFYRYAIVPAKKDFLSSDTPGTDVKMNDDERWLKEASGQQRWAMTSHDGLKLSAIYVPAAKDQGKTALIAHGYMGRAEAMASYIKMYHDLGYSVLAPDARGHGESEGNYIGFGWPERKDYVQWMDKILADKPAEELTLFGLSMGAGTVMMTSGESLPKNVVSIIEDCGYTSVNDQLRYQLKELFPGVPAFPLLQVTSLVTKVRAGYFFGEASAVKQLEKNTLPMFFIHGTKDDFVPYEMLDEVYAATKGPKEKWSVEGVKHATSYEKDPEAYKQRIAEFLAKYSQKKRNFMICHRQTRFR